MIIDIFSGLLLMLGAFFSLTGAMGLFKFPNFFTRVHAASVTDSIATILIILGLVIRTEFDLVTVKLLFIMVFLLLTTPAASHALAKSARHGGLLSIAEKEAEKKASSKGGNE